MCAHPCSLVIVHPRGFSGYSDICPGPPKCPSGHTMTPVENRPLCLCEEVPICHLHWALAGRGSPITGNTFSAPPLPPPLHTHTHARTHARMRGRARTHDLSTTVRPPRLISSSCHFLLLPPTSVICQHLCHSPVVGQHSCPSLLMRQHKKKLHLTEPDWSTRLKHDIWLLTSSPPPR